jgi:hypothetical protein
LIQIVISPDRSGLKLVGTQPASLFFNCRTNSWPSPPTKVCGSLCSACFPNATAQWVVASPPNPIAFHIDTFASFPRPPPLLPSHSHHTSCDNQAYTAPQFLLLHSHRIARLTDRHRTHSYSYTYLNRRPPLVALTRLSTRHQPLSQPVFSVLTPTCA